MPLIVPNVARYTVEGTYLDAPVANVIDMYIPDGWAGLTRDDAVEQVGRNVLTGWYLEILPVMKGQYIAQDVTWVDLNTADGSTGTVVVGNQPEYTFPYPGAIGGEPYTAAVATLVTKNTVARRGERQGRMFLCPPGEADIIGNTIQPDYLTALNSALSDFTEYLYAGTENSAYPVVVHQPAGGTFGTSTPVTGMTARARVSTQRRRNRA